MSATSAADYPTLGFDPTPGDTYKVSTLTSTLSNVSVAMNEISNVLHGAADGDWRGDAAMAFRDLLDDDLRPKVDKACSAFGDAHRCMSSWSASLEHFQSRARTLERDAAGAVGDAKTDAKTDAADDKKDGSAPTTPPGETPEDAADTYRTDAWSLNTDYVDEGKRIAGMLQDAIDIAPEEPGWFDSLVDSIGDFFDEIGDFLADIGDWVMEMLQKFAPLLDLLGDIAGLLSTVLGLLAFIPGLQFLALPALILAGVGLGMHYLSDVGKSGSFLQPLTTADFWLEAGGVALGAVGFGVASKLTKVATAAGNTRMVPQLIGQDLAVPYNMFTMANRGMSMTNTEGLLRMANLHLTYAGLGQTGAGAEGSAGTIGKIATWDFGPLTNKPVVS